jgi:putative transposase
VILIIWQEVKIEIQGNTDEDKEVNNMGTKRQRYSAEFKAEVALEALKGLKSVAELASDYQVHPTQINQWKKQLMEGADDLFGSHGSGRKTTAEAETASLYKEIERLTMEVEWLKKKMESVGS